MLKALGRIGIAAWCTTVILFTGSFLLYWFSLVRSTASLSAFNWKHGLMLVLVCVLLMVIVWSALAPFFNALLVRMGIALMLASLLQGALAYYTSFADAFAAGAFFVSAAITFMIAQMVALTGEPEPRLKSDGEAS